MSPEERGAFRVPPAIAPADWCDRHRRLDTGAKWNTAKTPYLRGILDAFDEPEVEEITIKKSTQVGGTEAILNQLAFAVDYRPSPMLLVQPTQPLVESFCENRIQPMLKNSPKLKRSLSARKWDTTKKEVKMRGCTLYLSGAESPATLASRAIRFLWLDETDKYPPYAGKEASPIKLARERTRTFRRRRKIIKNSTPTTRHGYIHLEWEKSLKFRFHVPCPHCGTYQPLVFKRIKWPRKATSEQVENYQQAHYECAECRKAILESQKEKMISEGVWVPEGGELPGSSRADNPGSTEAPSSPRPPSPTRGEGGEQRGNRLRDSGDTTERVPPSSSRRKKGTRGTDGVGCLEGELRPGGVWIRGDVEKSRHWGFHLNALYSPWLSWSDIAAEYLRSYKNPADLQNFVNSWEGEVWEEQIESVGADEVRRLVSTHEKGTVPEGAEFLTASIDVQASHFWVWVEAWGQEEESWLVYSGRAESWGEVETLLSRQWPVTPPHPPTPSPTGSPSPPGPLSHQGRGGDRNAGAFRDSHVGRGGSLGVMQVEIAMIDSGNWAEEVYAFCAKDPSVYLPVKGKQSMNGPLYRGYAAEIDPNTRKPERNGLVLWMCDTNRIKDRNTVRMKRMNPRMVHFYRDPDEDLFTHLLGEQKIVERDRFGNLKVIWKPVADGAPNHLWDCMVYSYCAMRILVQSRGGVSRGAKPPPDAVPDGPPATRRKEGKRGWVGKRKGWV